MMVNILIKINYVIETYLVPAMATPLQDNVIPDMSQEEKVSYLTRLSPKVPDQETLIWALACLAAAMIVVLGWSFFVSRKRFSLRLLAVVPVLASFLWFAVFLATDLFGHLSAEPLSSAMEPSQAARSLHHDPLLLEIKERLPEDAGILLVNCRIPRQVEWSKYLLYPREIMIRAYSLFHVDDPQSMLTPDACALLVSEGVDWVLNCDEKQMEKGLDAVLIPIRAANAAPPPDPAAEDEGQERKKNKNETR